MLQKRRKLIFVILAFLLVGLLIWLVWFHNSVPRLSRKDKELVRTEYFNRYCGGKMEAYREQPLIWYDENGHIEKEHVWRYVGTYGDCHAFLQIGDNKWDGLPTQHPYPLLGLSRNVFYPNEALVHLYHTKREFNSDEAPWIVDGATIRIELIYVIKNREKWITDEQLEQLTQDIEKIAKAYN